MNNNASYESLYFEQYWHNHEDTNAVQVSLEKWTHFSDYGSWATHRTYYILRCDVDVDGEEKVFDLKCFSDEPEVSEASLIRQAIAEFDALKARYFPEGEVQ